MSSLVETNWHISLQFHGDFRPLHVENADSPKSAVKSLLGMLVNPPVEILERIKSLGKDVSRQLKAGIGIVSASSGEGKVSITLREGGRDRWLDSMCAGFPPCEWVNYGKGGAE